MQNKALHQDAAHVSMAVRLVPAVYPEISQGKGKRACVQKQSSVEPEMNALSFWAHAPAFIGRARTTQTEAEMMAEKKEDEGGGKKDDEEEG